MVRHNGHVVSPSTVSRIMADKGLLLRAGYHRQRRELARQRSQRHRPGRSRSGLTRITLVTHGLWLGW